MPLWLIYSCAQLIMLWNLKLSFLFSALKSIDGTEENWGSWAEAFNRQSRVINQLNMEKEKIVFTDCLP